MTNPAVAWVVVGVICVLNPTDAPVASIHPLTRAVFIAARAQVGVTTTYDAQYRAIAFPGGDVPMDTGVCADVIIRALRSIDVDLQVHVNRDMRAHFPAYPRTWGLKSTDANVDHRRVLNLEVYMQRQGWSVRTGTHQSVYASIQPGDIVATRLLDGRPHIGIASDRRSSDGERPLLIHNWGQGAQEQDVLPQMTVRGIYRLPSAPAVDRRTSSAAVQ